ncbi:MAG: MHS family MFS transporter [Candidatus Eremiobacteraeota bacterium]|nr:MHS family MFS transporter [Candidatus Eremiobacteraeota bacterium]
MRSAVERRSPTVLVAAATLIGTSIEWYDFYIYGYAAALIFPTVFFPKSDPFIGQLASYGIFWVGFLGRPLGGVIFGHFGDKIGRKAMLLATLTIMGLATFLVGLLPTYSRIGIWAPLLLVGLRLCQGVAVGGEWGGAVVMAAEHARARFKGLLASCPQMGVPLGLILASVIFNEVTARSASDNGTAALGSIAWRIPFLCSIVLVVIGLGVRLSILETPAFERVKARAAIVTAPILSVLRNSWKTVLLAGGAFFVINGGFYLVTTQLVSYGAGPHSVLKLDPRIFFNANLAGSAVGLLANPFGGWLSDRIGRRPVYMTSVALILVVAFPFYALVDSKDPHLILLAGCLYSLPSSVAYGTLAAMFSELFGANVRYSGASLGYQGAAIFAGGLAPLVATLLLKFSGGASWVLALYLMVMAAISLISIYLLAETRQVDLADPYRVPAAPAAAPG